jgi:type VI secretion system protein ImpC
VGAYTFGREEEDIHLLQRIGLLAEAAEVPWFSAGDSTLLGCDSIEATPDPRDWTGPVTPLWPEFRGNPEACWISLALPSFLLRPPHGAEGSRLKSFDFEETVEDSTDLLWGNPAILYGIGLARAFATSGWSLVPPTQLTIDNVPLFTTREGWASPVRGSLSHSAAAQVRESGLSPVLGARNEAALRLQGVRSISIPENTLRAWWIGAP